MHPSNEQWRDSTVAYLGDQVEPLNSFQTRVYVLLYSDMTGVKTTKGTMQVYQRSVLETSDKRL